MKIRILTPFNREENKEKFIDHIRFFTKKYDIVLHLMIDKDIKFPKEDWIEVFSFTMPKNVDQKYYHTLNTFLKSEHIVNEDYYMFLNDDDFVEPDFFEKLKDIKSDFIIVSMKRGDHFVGRYPTTTLFASWRVMGRKGIGGEQIILKGKYLKGEIFRENNYTGDGRFIQTLWNKYPHKNFTFMKDVFVWFNYLEEGRWDK